MAKRRRLDAPTCVDLSHHSQHAKGNAEKALAAEGDIYMTESINICELWARLEARLPGNPG